MSADGSITEIETFDLTSLSDGEAEGEGDNHLVPSNPLEGQHLVIVPSPVWKFKFKKCTYWFII